MDIEYPYTEDIARLRLLYRLPDAPEPKRLLILANSPDDARLGDAWEGAVTLTSAASPAAAALADGGARYDVIALPSILGLAASGVTRGDARVGNLELLAGAAAALAPGGVIVGHMAHGRALRRLARPGRLAAVAVAGLRAGTIASAADCLRVLANAGLTGAECYYVEPNIGQPMALIPADAAAARAHFLRAVRSSRAAYSFAGYGLRLMMARLGLAGLLQRDLFFWARKPC
jgi:hypothetical protein